MSPRILERLAEVAWPTRCLGCDRPGELICDDCRRSLPWIEQRLACPVCGTPFGRLTCSGCRRGMESTSRAARQKDSAPALDPQQAGAWSDGSCEGMSAQEARLARTWPARATICALSLEGAPARMVTGLKDAHELRLAPVMAAAMACALDEASSWPARDGAARFDLAEIDALCFVPATAQAYARRGFDHMELIARSLSATMGIPYADLLVREQARDQRSLGREQRGENLARSLAVVGDVVGLDILLADDVVTTGSSMAAATHALLARGASSVVACSFARAW